MEFVDKNTIDHGNYKEIGAEICVEESPGVWGRSSFEVDSADVEDVADFKSKNSPRKYGLAKNGWIIGSKINGFQLKMAFRKTALWNPSTGEHSDLELADFSGLDKDGNCQECLGTEIDVELRNLQGGQSQTLCINSLPTIPVMLDYTEFSYWTEIQDDPDLIFLADGEVWDKENDVEAETIWLQQNTELDKDLLLFENVELSEFFYEKKRLVKRSGKLYLIESIPLNYLLNWDFSTPLELSYTTVSGALGSNTIWTAGTYYISGMITLGSYNLTIDPNVIVKINVNIHGLYANSSGIIVVNGTESLPSYITSMNDDSIGEEIAGSNHIPTFGDYDIAVQLAHASSSDEFNWCIIRYGGSAAPAQGIIYLNNAGVHPTFNNCTIEHTAVAAVHGAAAGAEITMNDCAIRYCTSTAGSHVLYATEVHLTNCHFFGVSGNYHIIRITGGSDSSVKNCFIAGGGNLCIAIVVTAGGADIYNNTIIGSNSSTNGAIYTGGNGVYNIKYNVVTGWKYALQKYAGAGTYNNDYNCLFGNTASVNGITIGANSITDDAQLTLNVPGTNKWPWLLQDASPCIGITTPDKVDDAGFEYSTGKTYNDSNTTLAATDNLPLGYLPDPTSGGAGAPAVDIDTVLKLAGTRTVEFDVSDTVQVTGSLESNVNITAATVSIKVKNLSDDALIATLYSGTTNLVAATPKTFATIAGAAVTWTATLGDRYIDVEVSGGTPAIDVTIDSEVTFAVTAASAPAVDIDTVLKLAGTRTVEFAVADSVQVTGSLESNINITAATVSITVKNMSDDALIATLYSGTADLVAATPKTFATIAGGALSWTATLGDRYIDVEVSGGTPAIDVTIDIEVTFAVTTSQGTAVVIDITINPALYTVGQTVSVFGSVTCDLDQASADVVIDIYNLSTGFLVENLFTGTYSFTADTAATLETIAGALVTYLTTASGNYYAKVTVSGGSLETTFSKNNFFVESVTVAPTPSNFFVEQEIEEIDDTLDVYGEAVTVEPKSGGSFPILAVVDHDSFDKILFADGDTQKMSAQLMIQITDYLEPKVEDIINVTPRTGGSAQSWMLKNWKPDDGGFWAMDVKRREPVNRKPQGTQLER